LFTTQPGDGHLNPLLPVAGALRDRGHEVLFATAASYVPDVERAGFSAVAAGEDWRIDRAAERFPEGASVQGREGLKWWIQNAFVGPLVAPMRTDLVALFDEWKPAVVVHDSGEVAAILAAEPLGLPCAAVYLGIEPGPGAASFFAEPWERVRAEAGLPPDPSGECLSGGLGLVFTPPSWGALFGVPLATTHRIRMPGFDRATSEKTPSWSAGLGQERPFIYASLGTSFAIARRVLKAIIAALGELPVDAVVTVGRINDPERLGPAPANVRVEQYVPQSHLLPRASAMVCHSGFSTVLGALGCGVPLVLLPMGADHFVNAESCTRLGVATVVEDVLDADAIARAADALLESQDHRIRAEVLREEIEGLPGLDHAAELIERLALTQSPVTNRTGDI
jgi:UDP:flavonoid glycosyltransferase YjiC (YdhE family)